MQRSSRDKIQQTDEYSALDTRESVREEPLAVGHMMDRATMGMGTDGGGGISVRNLKTFSSFRNHTFRLFYGAMLGQMASMNMQMIARSLLVYRLTGSATILGVMALANAAPMLFLSLYGGVIADRVQKKYILLAGQASSAVITLAVALTLTLGYLSPERTGSWWILLMASLAQGTIMGLMMPSRQAILAEIVGEEQLMNAVALNTFGMNTLRLIAPAIAGLLIDAFGFQATYYAMTGMYLIAVGFILAMPLTGTIAIKGRGALADIKDGFRYIQCQPTILLILAFTLIVVLLSMPYMMLLPVFTEDILDIGARGMGVLISISGIGAMVGSLILASLPNKKRGLMLVLGSLGLGLALVGFSFSQSLTSSLIFIVFVGLGQTIRMTLGNTLLMYYVDDEYRGRVMSIYMMEFGLTSFGVFVTGVLTDSIGVQWAIGGLAMALVLISTLAFAFVPRLRNLD